ncbi:MAG: sigma-54-dependent Fis family transcriptional regulator [Phycisphaerae bacterium]|nr:sigma-54-dependent Fis family transcriptional regulator [Phycisphaerae bacterium]
MGIKKLPNQDRRFFRLVADATFTNPFSEERPQIDRQVAGVLKTENDWRKIVPLAVDAIRQRLRQLDVKQPCRFQDFDKQDAELMRYTFLFEVYHNHATAFDNFILEQQQNDNPVKVPFGATAVRELVHRGFSEEQAIQYFSMFYQIRRAFYFIHQGLVGKSGCMRKLRMDLWNNIFTYDIRDYEQYLWDRMEDFSTLLEGPTGSGKGAAAAAIGRSGFIPYDPVKKQFAASFTTMFLPINLSQYAEGLLESELFGHTKGAFTGAVAEHKGILSLCEKHGAIFLDEIGEVSIPAQVKLLKVLEERTFSPVGSHESKRFYGRVIAATNRPIETLRRENKFRDDFYYRLCSDCIHVPPLARRIQENKNELAELVRHFTRTITGKENRELSNRVMDVIETRLGRHYPWPGNVRELAQCIRRVILKRDYEGQTLQNTDLKEQLLAGVDTGSLTAEELLNHYCQMLYKRHGSYEEVARRTGMDRRTVKKHITKNRP